MKFFISEFVMVARTIHPSISLNDWSEKGRENVDPKDMIDQCIAIQLYAEMLGWGGGYK